MPERKPTSVYGWEDVTTTKSEFKSLEQAQTENRILAKSKLRKLKEDLQRILPTLAKHNVEDLRTLIHQTYVKRFKRSRIPKYGNLNKGFTEYELQKFFRAIENDKFKLLFSYQAQLGLRIGEAVKLNVKDINVQTRELTLKTEKARIIDTLLVPMQLFKQTLDFIAKNEASVKASNGYVFFKDCGSASRLPYLKNVSAQ